MENAEIMALKILDARERRVEKQKSINDKYKRPIVSFSMNIPGPNKDSLMFRKAFDSGVDSIIMQIGEKILSQNIQYLETGSEAIFAVEMDVYELKNKMLEIEINHPLGRFFDIDVMDEKLKGISRSDVGMKRRECFVCHKEATVCRREGNHTLDELIGYIEDSINNYFGENT